jgi:ABC-type multidrug transport system ATPase subunit
MKPHQIAKALKILKDYKTIANDDELKVFSESPWENLTEISAKLNSQGVLTEKIEIVEPTLEDVFMKLSGRRLTEAEN